MPKHIPDIKVGRRVTIDGIPGMIKYDGYVGFQPGRWVGIELDKPQGTNSGRIKGRWYFDCKPDHGVFIRRDNYIKKFMGIDNLPIDVGGGGGDDTVVITADEAIRKASRNPPGSSPVRNGSQPALQSQLYENSSASKKEVSISNPNEEYTKKVARDLLMSKLSSSQVSLQDFITTELQQLDNPEQFRTFIANMPEKERELLRTVDVPKKLKTLTRQPALSDSKTKEDDVKNGDFALELAMALISNDDNIIDALSDKGTTQPKDIKALKQYKDALKIELAHCLARYGSGIKDSRSVKEFISHQKEVSRSRKSLESMGNLSNDAEEIHKLRAETEQLNTMLGQRQDDYLREEYKRLLADKDAWHDEKMRLQRENRSLQENIASLEASRLSGETEKFLYRQKMEAQAEQNMEKQMLQIEERETKLRLQKEEAEKNIGFIKNELKRNEKELKNGFEELEQEKRSFRRDIAAFKEEREYSKSLANKQVEEKNAEIVQLRMENKSLRQELQTFVGEKGMSMEEISKQKIILVELEKKIRADQKRVQDGAQELQREKMALKEEISRLKKQLSESNAETERRLAQMKRDENVLAEAELLHEMKEELKRDRILLVKELEDCKDRMLKVTEREDSLENAKRQLESRENRLESKEREMAKKIEESRLVKENYENLTQKMEDSLWEKEKEMTNSKQALENEKRSLEREKAALLASQENAEHLNRQLKSQQASLDETRRDLELEKKKIDSDRQALMKEQECISKNERNLDQEYDELMQIKEEIEEAKLEIKKDRAELERQQKSTNQIVRDVSLSQEALDKVRTEVEAEKEMLQDAKDMVHRMRLQNRELSEDLQRRQNDCQERQYALQDERLRMVERNTQLNEKESKLQQGFDNLERSKASLREERGKLEKDRSDFLPDFHHWRSAKRCLERSKRL